MLLNILYLVGEGILFSYKTESNTCYGCNYKLKKCGKRKTWPSLAFFCSHFETL